MTTKVQEQKDRTILLKQQLMRFFKGKEIREVQTAGRVAIVYGRGSNFI